MLVALCLCYLWFPRVTLYLYDNRQLTVCGFVTIAIFFICFTLVYVHADGAECLLIARQEASPCLTNGILLANIHSGPRMLKNLATKKFLDRGEIAKEPILSLADKT